MVEDVPHRITVLYLLIYIHQISQLYISSSKEKGKIVALPQHIACDTNATDASSSCGHRPDDIKRNNLVNITYVGS